MNWITDDKQSCFCHFQSPEFDGWLPKPRPDDRLEHGELGNTADRYFGRGHLPKSAFVKRGSHWILDEMWGEMRPIDFYDDDGDCVLKEMVQVRS